MESTQFRQQVASYLAQRFIRVDFFLPPKSRVSHLALHRIKIDFFLLISRVSHLTQRIMQKTFFAVQKSCLELSPDYYWNQLFSRQKSEPRI